MINMRKDIKIHINIWDDYYDDAYPGEIQKLQETYAYVEESNISHEKCKEYLNVMLNYIQKNLVLNGVEMKLEFHDTKNDYKPELVEKAIKEYGENFFFKRWEIKFKHLTHERREELVEELKEANLSSYSIPFSIYSES